MFEFNNHTKWILGRPHYWCASVIVPVLRAEGQEIAKKAEDEQAAVIYWMLQAYEEHGENWREKLYELIAKKREMDDRKTEKGENKDDE